MKLRAVIALLILALVRASAHGQTLTTGQISGTVTDPSGAVVPKAQVTVSNTNTGIKRTTESNGDGYYLVPLLDPGTYVVTIAAKGFETVSREGITVAVSRSALVDFRLQIGAGEIKMTVSTDAPLIEPSNPNTTTTFSATQLANIPNPGNDLSYVANLAPGAIINTSPSNYPYNAGNVEFNGLPSIANDFTIDGLDANTAYYSANAKGASGLQLGLNAIQEVSISTDVYSVDQGRLSGSQVSYVTKSGTNTFHGNAYEIWNGSAMNANNFFLNANGQHKPRSNVNEFGASLGGPLVKDKLFFFSDLEGVRLVLPDVLTSTLPTPAYENYVLQQLPLGGTDPVLGTQLPPQPAEVPLYQNMFKLLGDTSRGVSFGPIPGCPLNADGSLAPGSPPDGNGCANVRTFSTSPSASETLFTIKFDYTLDPSNTFWFRFQLNQGQSVQVDPVSSVFNYVLKVPSRAASAGWTHVFRPNLVNQFNPGIAYLPGISNLANPTQALAAFPILYSVSPFSTIGNHVYSSPSGVNTTTWQLNDNLSWNKGRNAFKFGADLRRFLMTTETAFFVHPYEIGSSLPEFTHGATSFTIQSFPLSPSDRLRAVSMGTYAMDAIKISPKLTLTLGLRADWVSNPVSSGRAFTRLNASSFEELPHDVNRPLNLDLLPFQSHVFVDTPLLRWEPRVAVAYQLRSTTLVRVGAGYFDQPLNYSRYGGLTQNPPTYNTFNAGIFTAVGGVGIAPGVPGSAVDAAVAANQQYQTAFVSGELSCSSSLSTPGASRLEASQQSIRPSMNGAPLFNKRSAAASVSR